GYGVATLTATSQAGGDIAGSPAQYNANMPIPTGSLRIPAGAWFASKSGINLGVNQTAFSLILLVRINSFNGTNQFVIQASSNQPVIIVFQTNSNLLMRATGQSHTVDANVNWSVGNIYHLALSWANGAQTWYLDGIPVATGSNSEATAPASGTTTW